MSTLFNVGGKERFTPKDMLHVILLSDFAKSADAYLQSDVYHNNFVALPKAETVPYWQGSGVDYSFEEISKIHVNTSSNNEVTVTKSQMKRYLKENKYGLIALVWTAVTATLLFTASGRLFGGTHTFLRSDLYGQYISLIHQFLNALFGSEEIDYSLSS